jgi:hypothetical protein
MSTTPTVINFVDTETVVVTGDNSNPRNVTFDVPPASATTLGSIMFGGGDLGGTGLLQRVIGIMGYQLLSDPDTHGQVVRFSTANAIPDSGILGELLFDYPIGGEDARSTSSETIDADSYGDLISLSDGSPVAPIAVALDSTVGSRFRCEVLNKSSQTATLTPSSGTIDDGTGAASSKTLAAGTSCTLFFNGTNWRMLKGAGSGGGSSPLTTKGDLYTYASADARLAVGSNGQALVADSTQTNGIKWKTLAESDITNLTSDLAAKALASRLINTTAPITGGGDLSADRTIAISNFTGDSGSGGAKGAVPAPAAGDAAAGKFLKADGTWATAGSSSPLSTKGDIYTHDSSVDARLAVGSNGQALVADSTQTTGVKWKSLAESDITNLTTDLAAKLTNPMTTKGDVIYGDTSGVPTRLAAGTTGYVLTSNGSGNAPSYQGVGTLALPDWLRLSPDAPPSSANAMDDEFNSGSTIDTGLWTVANAGTVTNAVAKSCLQLTYPPHSGDAPAIYYQAMPSAPWEFTAKVSVTRSPDNYVMAGLCIYDSANTKVQIYGVNYASDQLNSSIGSWVGTHSAGVAWVFNTSFSGQVNSSGWIWLRYARDGSNNLTASLSFDGIIFYPLDTRSITSHLTTPSKIGLSINNNNGSKSRYMICDYFRRTA